MTENQSNVTRHLSLLLMGLAGIFLWVQLFRLITNTPPTSANLVVAFGLLFLATTATGGLLSWAVHARLAKRYTMTVLLRQGAWAGLLVVLYAWLTYMDVLSWFVGVMLLALFTAVEVLILLRGSG